MRIYTVHQKPGLDARGDPQIVLVKEGFCWPAFLFTPIWALVHRQWLGLIAYVVLISMLSVLLAWARMGPVAETLAGFMVQLYVGAQANDWRRWTLRAQGYRMVATVLGNRLDEAERRFFTHTLAAPPPAASANIG